MDVVDSDAPHNGISIISGEFSPHVFLENDARLKQAPTIFTAARSVAERL